MWGWPPFVGKSLTLHNFPAPGAVFRVSFFIVAHVHSTLHSPAYSVGGIVRPSSLNTVAALSTLVPGEGRFGTGVISARACDFLPKLFQGRSRFPSYCRLLKHQTNKFSTICQCRSPATTWHCLWILALWSNSTSASQNKRHNSKRNKKVTSSQTEILNKSIVANCQQQLCGLHNLVWPSGRAIPPKPLISYG